jgi:hypothetical protein
MTGENDLAEIIKTIQESGEVGKNVEGKYVPQHFFFSAKLCKAHFVWQNG